jgi:hypothetical protein
MMDGLTSSASNMYRVIDDITNPYRNIVIDAMRMNRGHTDQCPIIDEEPNASATKFFDILKDFNEPLWDGCINYDKLLTVP